MEDKTPEQLIKAELLALKANAYDISGEINRLNNILQQTNARITQLTQQLFQTPEEPAAKPTKGKKGTNVPF